MQQAVRDLKSLLPKGSRLFFARRDNVRLMWQIRQTARRKNKEIEQISDENAGFSILSIRRFAARGVKDSPARRPRANKILVAATKPCGEARKNVV
ncbi:MAG: hypothetical protein Q4C72_01175 [Eubacteriales bacterium]|nr:hypothetical protein [Eubacteriales bacterium]